MSAAPGVFIERASFWDIIWFIIVSFAFIAYLMILFNILGDLFRDKSVNGWVKAIWIVFLIIFPFITALIYLIARGAGMAQRSAENYADLRQAQDAHIRSVAGSGSASPAEEIAKAKALAGERIVAVAAGDVGGQTLALGLVDEVAMDVVPVVFGSGKRYFGPVKGQHLLEDPDVVIQGDRVLHLRYQVRC